MALAIPESARDAVSARFGLDLESEHDPLVPVDQVLALAQFLKNELDFGYLVYCAAAHFPATDDREAYYWVAYRVRRFGEDPGSFPFRVEIPMDGTTPSLAGLWAGADWQEREQFDLVGVVFEDHPDLRRIMMPEDWPGHPLHRDYAIETRHFPWR